MSKSSLLREKKIVGCLTDIHNYQRHLKQALQRLSSSSMADDDRQHIKGFADRLQAEGISRGRIVKYINHLKIYAELVGSAQGRPWFKESTRKDVEHLVGRIEASDYKPHTKHDYKVVLRRFYQWLRDSNREDDEYPKEVRWIKTTIKKNEKKLSEDLLSEEEVLQIADHALCQSDRAFALLLYDSGGMIGEILPLRIKDITFDGYETKVRVSGKTGERRMRAIVSAPALLKHISEHPFKDDPETPVWLGVDEEPSSALELCVC